MKLVDFTDKSGKPVYVNPESVALLRRLENTDAEETVVFFIHGGFQVVRERIEIVHCALLGEAKPI